MNLKKAYAMLAVAGLCAATAAVSQQPAEALDVAASTSNAAKDAIMITGTVDSNVEVATLMREMETDKFIETPTLDFVRKSGDRVEFQISGRRPATKLASSNFDGK